MSTSFECQGVIHHIGETEEVGERGFKKRIIVLNTGGEFPQYPVFEFVQARTAELDYVKVGQQATISFNLQGSGKPYNDRYYGSLRGWRIKSTTEAAPPPPPEPTAPDPLAEEPKAEEPKAAAKPKEEKPAETKPKASAALDDEEDDLPF